MILILSTRIGVDLILLIDNIKDGISSCSIQFLWGTLYFYATSKLLKLFAMSYSANIFI